MELLHTENDRIMQLARYFTLLASGGSSRDSYDEYKTILETALPYEVNDAIDEVISRTADIDTLKQPVSRFIRAVGKALDAFELPQYPADGILAKLNEQNRKIAEYLSALQNTAEHVREGSIKVSDLTALIALDTLIPHHYEQLQNELFPLFEKTSNRHSCVKLMWAIQNDVLDLRKKLVIYNSPEADKEFWILFGSFFLTANSLVYREKRILFPAAYRALPPSEQKPLGTAVQSITAAQSGAVYVSETGSLDFSSLDAIFKVLPVDISFIGADDRLQYYSDPPDRIFPRSPAVIGRLVQNCHPPKSVAMVEEIISSFKNGTRNTAEFYLTVKDKFIVIRYYAVRSPEGTYLGTLEVSEDAAHIRSLEGEKRLL